MRVATRLYLAALPSVLGVLVVAGLAYWGQYARTVPEVILIIAIAATIATVVMSWINVRYVALRVERMARTGRDSRGSAYSVQRSVSSADNAENRDELDTIEGVVARLTNAVQVAEGDRARAVLEQTERRREYAQVLASVAANGTLQLDDVRLPLHILLENHFGELNENQEEMLGAARISAERISGELAAMADLARLELGQLSLRRDRVFPADIANAILPVIRAQANARDVEINVDITPLVPAFHVDASRLQQALQLLLTEACKLIPTGAQASLSLISEDGHVVFQLAPVNELPDTTAVLVARRTVQAMEGQVVLTDGSLSIAIKA